MNTVRICTARMRAYLEAFEQTGTLIGAQRITGTSRSTHKKWMRERPEYAAAFRESEDVAIEAMEAEARRRAVEGVDRPVYGKGGQVYGVIREHSDQLLMFLLKAARPDRYRERVDLTVDIRREAERIAAAAGMETDAVIAEAERLIAEARATPG